MYGIRFHYVISPHLLDSLHLHYTLLPTDIDRLDAFSPLYYM